MCMNFQLGTAPPYIHLTCTSCDAPSIVQRKTHFSGEISDTCTHLPVNPRSMQGYCLTDHPTPSSRTHLFSEPHKVGFFILCEHPKVGVEDLLEQQHEELFLNTSLILPWLSSKDHLQGRHTSWLHVAIPMSYLYSPPPPIWISLVVVLRTGVSKMSISCYHAIAQHPLISCSVTTPSSLFCEGCGLETHVSWRPISLLPRPNPLTRWPLSNFSVVPSQQSWYWTTQWNNATSCNHVLNHLTYS